MYGMINKIGIIMILLIWGCSNNSTEPVVTVSDEQVIMEILQDIETSDTADYFYADLDEQSEDEFIADEEGLLQKPIIPVKFGRIGLRPVVKDIRIDFTSDTTATVYFKKVMRGRFSVVTMDSAFNPVRIPRKMGHQFNRIAHFVRHENSDQDRFRGWRLKSFSMVAGESLGVVDSNRVKTTLEITEVQIEAGDMKVIIKDPLEYFQKRNNMFRFAPGTEVALTVHVKNNSQNTLQVPAEKGTELVRLHFARHRQWRDNRLEKYGMRYLRWIRSEDGQNVYKGTWRIGDRFRVHHAVIDVIDNGTIFDDDTELYPYNSVTWSTPYKIMPLN